MFLRTRRSPQREREKERGASQGGHKVRALPSGYTLGAPVTAVGVKEAKDRERGRERERERGTERAKEQRRERGRKTEARCAVIFRACARLSAGMISSLMSFFSLPPVSLFLSTSLTRLFPFHFVSAIFSLFLAVLLRSARSSNLEKRARFIKRRFSSNFARARAPWGNSMYTRALKKLSAGNKNGVKEDPRFTFCFENNYAIRLNS